MAQQLLPPKLLNLFLVVAVGLHFLFPIIQIIDPPSTLFGFIVISLGIILNFWAFKVLGNNNTTIDFNGKTTRLVTTGPFQISRNPMYLGGVVLSLGIAVTLGSLSTFVFPLALLLILNTYYIPYEEMNLEKEFGDEYREYKRRVRRWI
ncbi:MAG: methyltransferase family protein [Candidatus Heimdallarchaeota archaeon]